MFVLEDENTDNIAATNKNSQEPLIPQQGEKGAQRRSNSNAAR